MSTSNVDERIVEMTFKGSGFAQDVSKVVEALQTLKDHLNFKGEENSLNDLDNAGKRFSLSGMSNAADNVASHFNAMRVVAYTAIANITSRALNAGISIAKSLTIDPIRAGLDVYETKINAIQTILANTQAQGTTLPQITAALAELNKYANLTVYNFGEMTKNIGTFTAAGVDLNTSVASIKGIANLAALSGASAEQASSAMYQLSQAIAAGSVKLQDWNSVVNAGLGGKVFQKALVDTARASGVAVDAIIKKQGSFRQSLQTGWLTSGILTKTLAQFTGDLTDKQLRAMGFTEAESQAILKQGKIAQASATNIRTITQLMQALKEEVATAWASVWETLVGNIGTATSRLSKLHNVLENFFTKPIYDLNNFLKGFAKLGGIEDVIQIIKNLIAGIKSVLDPIKSAFKDIFPPLTVTTLIVFIINLETLTSKMHLSKAAGEELRRTFEGIFSIFRIILDVVGDVFKGFGHVGTATAAAGTGILSVTAKIGDFLVKVKNFVESGGVLVTIFKDIGLVLTLPIRLFGLLSGGMDKAANSARAGTNVVEGFFKKVTNALKGFGQIILTALNTGTLSNLLTLVNQGIFATLLLAIRNWFKGLGKAAPKKGLFDTIKESFEQLTGTLKTMQANLKSDILLKIAAAVGIITASMIALSFINPAKLGKALGAISAVFLELEAATAVLVKISASGGIFKMIAISGALILLSTAVLILSGAVGILAQFSWEQLAKGLGSIAVILIEFAAFAALTGGGKTLIGTAIALNFIATAVNVLAIAVGILGKMDVKTLAKGVGTIAAILLIFAGFNAISGKQSVFTATALVIVAAALLVIAKAVAALGSLPIGTIGKGLAAIGGALLLIVLAINLLPITTIVTATGLLILAGALLVISKVMQNLGGLSWSQIARSLVELAGALAIIVIAMALMTGALPGAVALVIVAGALAVLAPVLIALGSLSWTSILKGLAALAGVFLVLGVAALLLTPLIPTLLLLGAAITLLGIGVLAAGAGIFLFAAGLGTIGVALAALGTGIVAFVSQIVGLVPLIVKEVGTIVIAIATVIKTGAPAIVGALVAVLTSLFTAIIKIVPLAVKAFGVLIGALLTVVGQYAPRIIAAMIELVVTLLTTLTSKAPRFVAAATGLVIAIITGIANNIFRVVSAATNLIIAFINSIGAGTIRVVNAGINMVINLINGIANSINSHTAQLRQAGLNLAGAIINGMTFGIFSGASSVENSLISMASNALDKVKSFLGINSPAKKFIPIGESMGEGTAVGVDNASGMVVDSVTMMGKQAVEGMRTALKGVSDLVDGNLKNLNPTITPVLDLTQAKTGFATLASLSKDRLLNVGSPLAKATSISADHAEAAQALAAATVAAPAAISFIQNNTSPKALDAATIYRQSNNLISAAKGALSK